MEPLPSRRSGHLLEDTVNIGPRCPFSTATTQDTVRCHIGSHRLDVVRNDERATLQQRPCANCLEQIDRTPGADANLE